MNTNVQTIQVLGSTIHILGSQDIVDRMGHWIDTGPARCYQVVVTGFHGLWEAHTHKQFRTMLSSADLWVPDGIAPVWVARWHGLKQARRTPGAEIMQTFFRLANWRGYRSFFYGDTDDTLARLKTTLEQQYPGHKVVGTYSPPFRPLTPAEDEAVIQMINDTRPDVLWVGLGLPKQERWIYEHKDRLKVPVAVGVGAAFGFLSGKVKRVPLWVGDRGLEWLWRLAMEPKKLWRRDLLDGPRFLFHVGMELAGLRKY